MTTLNTTHPTPNVDPQLVNFQKQQETTPNPPASLLNIEEIEEENNITEASNKYTKIKKRKEELEDDPEYTDILKELQNDTEYQSIQFDDDIEDEDVKIKAKKERKELENNIYNKGILPKPNKGGRKPRLIVKKTLRRKKYRGGTLQDKLKGILDKIANTDLIKDIQKFDLTEFLSN